MLDCLSSAADAARPVWCVTRESLAAADLPESVRRFAEAASFAGEAGKFLLAPGPDGTVAGALFGVAGGARADAFATGALPALLPAGDWRLVGEIAEPRLAALAFALGTYHFSRYRSAPARAVHLVPPEGVDVAALTRTVEAVRLTRDLVNTPANDLGPAELEDAARALAARHGAGFCSIVGDALLAQNFPLIHAVGRAATGAPRLLEIRAGDPAHPKVTLVGKGVCFDTGGLDLKPSAAMLLMKKDMGGAANALGLAHLLLARKAKVNLRVLIPAVENSVAGAAFRPGDVLKSRKGLSVEIGNTDAEGRLVLADALALADEEAPELIVDFATLTGAARVALGPQLPPAFTHDEALAADLARHAAAEADPLWRLPLWAPYAGMLDSKVADTNNVSSGAFAGAITAALFLEKFVSAARSWLHLDIFAWNPSARPGRPEGGEAQTIRALDALLAERYG
ncbi:leucyl aminopeptidase family protein [Xanthobacter dioxanivorans]|uniref:Leucyl aminopeptidase family protein n=1 Tax=Xanthobacter dioxanivorans TaxID=2528964 RepID=A0A974PQ82_9HYPH|nr:leucyl aminopeptidase family protein [Xanthobacter dioxanivorans]QRG07738.1 leucyl aminopeptidase family protein [Xanthobacter dioxanivorans]